jgi:hypothetical protein
VSATPGIIGPVQRAELQPDEYARPVARSLFNIAQFPKTASCFFLVFHRVIFRPSKSGDLFEKKDRAAFAGGPSQGGNALGGQQQRGAIADLVLQIKKPRALTGLNLCSRFCCSRYIHAVDAPYRDADHVDGSPHDSRIN